MPSALPRRRQRCGAYDDRRLASRTDAKTCACASSSCDERSNANANASSFASCDLGWSDAYANGYASCLGCGCGSCCGSSSCSSASSCSSGSASSSSFDVLNACCFLVICACGERCGFDRPAWTDERPSDVPVTSVPSSLLFSVGTSDRGGDRAWLPLDLRDRGTGAPRR